MKLSKKSFSYLAIVCVLGVVFLSYNFRHRVINTLVDKKLLTSEVVNKAVCPKPSVCLNDDELKSLIMKEVPLLSQDVSDLEKVSALREWVFDNVPLSSPDLLIDNLSTSIHPNNIPPGTRIQIFREGLAGARCGATGQTLREVYDLLGFEAYTVNQGDPESKGTHVFNIVKINHKGKELFSVQDAYLNCFISDVNGNPLSYFKFLSLLKEKKHQEITFQYGKINGDSQKFRLLTPEEKASNLYKTFSNGNKLAIAPFNPSSVLLDRCTPRFEQDHYPLNFIYICAYPFGISGKNRKTCDFLLATALDITEIP